MATREHQTLTRAEAAALDAAGLLDGARFELIEGALIHTRGKTWRHVKVTKAAGHALAEVFGWDFVQQASPIDVAPEDRARNEPEPDVTVLRRTFLDFDDTPAPADVALAVEVADTSLWQDLVTKAGLYARAGIQEYWVLDVKTHRLHVHRDPRQGEYRERLDLGDADSVAPLEKPDAAVAVRSMLSK